MTINSDELQSRRDFFKKAAKGVLPFIGLVAWGPSFLISCSKDDDDGTPKSQKGGDGTLSHPFSVAEAIVYAISMGINTECPEVYIKGRVEEIYSNFSYEKEASFLLTDGNGNGEADDYTINTDGEAYSASHTIAVVSSYLGGQEYHYGDILKVGDSVIIYGTISFFQVGDYKWCRVWDGYLYSLNGNPYANSSCSDCAGACSGTCSVTCGNGCFSTCGSNCSKNCTTTCSGGCKEECSTGCNTTCKDTCSTTCQETCSTTCQGGCDTSCKGGCRKGCASQCTTGCKSACTILCSYTCSGTCRGSCTGTLSGSSTCSGCSSTCASSSTGSSVCSSCAAGCTSGCTGVCATSCELSCVTSCKGTCDTSCKDTCFGSCKITCQGWTK